MNVFSINFSPLFTSKDFPLLLSKTDRQGHMRALEMIALKGEKLILLGHVSETIVEVVLESYSQLPLYTDSRFLTKNRAEIKSKTPSKDEIEAHLRSRIGVGYLWGGNVAKGVEAMEQYYPLLTCSLCQKRRMKLAGLDCSGLLYEASCGKVARNSRIIFENGKKVDHLEPLDLIVYPGHVIIALSETEAIQSKENRGVFVSSLEKELYYVNKRHPERRFIRPF